MELGSAEKILIVRLSSLGDILLSTPLVRSIRKKYPSVKIDYLLREQYKEAMLHNPNIDTLLTFENNHTDEIKNKIREGRYSVVIDLQNNFRSAGLLDNSDNKIKFAKRTFSKFLLVHFKINMLKSVPPIPERYAAGIANFKLDGKGPELFTNKLPSEIFNSNSRYIGLAPGARHFTKRWLPEYYIELGKMLISEGYKLVLFGGTDDMNLCSEISRALPGSFNLSNNNDLLQTSADMKKCLAVVCNDSGLMHTASSSGVPVIAIFGSTVKEFGFAPYKTKNKIVENTNLSCRPCTHIGRKSCPKKHFKCIKEIMPADVHKNLISLLKE